AHPELGDATAEVLAPPRSAHAEAILLQLGLHRVTRSESFPRFKGAEPVAGGYVSEGVNIEVQNVGRHLGSNDGEVWITCTRGRSSGGRRCSTFASQLSTRPE